MVLATENASGIDDASSNSLDTSYEIVETKNVTAGLQVTGEPEHEMPAESEEERPSTPTQNFLNEISNLKQIISKHRAENITLDIKAGQLEREREDLRVELSRCKMALAKEKAESGKRKTRYDELLEDVQLGSDKLSKKLVKYKRQNDELETRLKTELAAQKTFWQEINQQLYKESEHSLAEITQLNEELQAEKTARAQEKQDAKSGMGDLEDQLEDALQDKVEMQIQLERVKVENAKLRQEKTSLSTNYEERISKIGARTPAPDTMENFSTEDMLQMMQETLGDDIENYDE